MFFSAIQQRGNYNSKRC